MNAEREKCTKLILERLLEVYGEFHNVTMTINYDGRNKLSDVTDIVDSAITLIESLISENKQDNKLCKCMPTVTAMLVGLKQRIGTVMRKEYKAPKGIGERQQREKLATPVFTKLLEVRHNITNIISQTSSKKIKKRFECILDSVSSALFELNTFVTNDPITEALREDLCNELKRLINETHSIKIQLEQIS